MHTTTIRPQGPFDLAASTRFLEGFTPTARPDAAAEPGVPRLAFPAGARRRGGARAAAPVAGHRAVLRATVPRAGCGPPRCLPVPELGRVVAAQ